MRTAVVERNTKETKINLKLNIDGAGTCKSETGVGFFDHMLDGFARHGLFDLEVKVDGDLFVDCHHTIEDTGIVLGQAIKEAVGDKKSIKRYGSCILPTNGTAKFFGPLSVDDFVKKSSIIYYSKEALEPIHKDIIKFATSEQLTAHANSIKVRFEEEA